MKLEVVMKMKTKMKTKMEVVPATRSEGSGRFREEKEALVSGAMTMMTRKTMKSWNEAVEIEKSLKKRTLLMLVDSTQTN